MRQLIITQRGGERQACQGAENAVFQFFLEFCARHGTLSSLTASCRCVVVHDKGSAISPKRGAPIRSLLVGAGASFSQAVGCNLVIFSILPLQCKGIGTSLFFFNGG